MNLGRDFYLLLNVRKNSPVEEILQAYKRLASEVSLLIFVLLIY